MTDRCKTCGQRYTPDCDWNQGRCPHHPSSVDLYHLRYYNLLQAIKNFFRLK